MKITLNEIIEARSQIEACAGDDDDERAHGLEDELWERVLQAIAAGAENSRELAAEALKTKDMAFARWCA